MTSTFKVSNEKVEGNTDPEHVYWVRVVRLRKDTYDLTFVNCPTAFLHLWRLLVQSFSTGVDVDQKSLCHRRQLIATLSDQSDEDWRYTDGSPLLLQR